MDKRIIMVERGSACPNSIVGRDGSRVTYVCGLTDEGKECLFAGIPDWCPLPKMPEEMELPKGDIREIIRLKRYIEGYNDCLNEIKGQPPHLHAGAPYGA